MFKKGWQPKEYKGLNDEIRQQHKKAKDMSFKEKWNYFWYYYKIHTIVAIVAAALVFVFIHDLATAKDTSFYGIMLNAYALDGNALESSFSEYAELDTENYECFIDTSTVLSYQSQTGMDYSTFQKLAAMMQTKELDAVIADGQVFYSFSFNGMFMNLEELLSPEELDKYKAENRVYYLDYAEVRRAEESEENDPAVTADSESHRASTTEEMADEANAHRYPENMEEPVPVGIFVDESPLAVRTNIYTPLVPIYGVPVTTQRAETAKKYLDYMWDENIAFEEMITTY